MITVCILSICLFCLTDCVCCNAHTHCGREEYKNELAESLVNLRLGLDDKRPQLNRICMSWWAWDAIESGRLTVHETRESETENK